MRRASALAASALFASLASCSAPAGSTQDAHAGPSGSICLRDGDIDHTRVVDDQTILFFMHGQTVYRNRLDRRCVGLRNDSRGFSYEPTDPGSNSICSNLVIITTNTDHNVCSLGAFERLERPPAD